jgi:ElaB/YqjD/DUF883 family membrane-anchored ribosome-binding protein
MNRPGEHGPTFQEQPGRPTAGHTETSSGVAGTVKEQAQNLASAASNVAGQVKEKAQEWTSSVARGAEQAWDSTRQHTREWAHQAADTAENAWEGFGDLIRKYPVPSLFIALGVGFVLGGGLAAGSRRSWS